MEKVELNVTLTFFVIELLIFSASPQFLPFLSVCSDHLYVASLLN